MLGESQIVFSETASWGNAPEREHSHLTHKLSKTKEQTMDEQRKIEYIILIDRLLHCPKGQEARLFNENRELLDLGLLQVMAEVAEQLEAKGKQNAADFLRNLGTDLKRHLDISQTTVLVESPESSLQEDCDKFMLEVLETILKTKTNPQAVYSLFAANLDKLDYYFIPILQTFLKKTLYGQTSSQAEAGAKLIGNFCTLIQQFPLGSVAANNEIAIAGYEICLKVLTHRSQRSIWATFQNNLGSAYRDRIVGNKTENLEKAIAIYKKALKVVNQKNFPRDWARIQNNLGIAYCDRILGNKAENVEKGINAYKQALKVKDFPKEWAMTQSNLSDAYCDRLAGDRAENIEKAISACQLALEVYTKKDDRQDWARTQHNLGLAYLKRIKGNRAENLEKAIALFQLVLATCSKKDSPRDWARAQNNLGNACLYRIKGDKAENIEIAIAAFQRALEVRTKKDFPKDWAITQSLLGIAYYKRRLGDKAENIEIAIAALQRALEVCTKKDSPKERAITQYNLGLAYSARLAGDKAENEEKARTAYQLALEFFAVKNNPIEYMGANCNLGSLYFSRGDWQEAIAAYEKAIAVIDDIGSLPSTDARSQRALTDTICAYMNIVQCFVNLKQYDKAIEYVVRSRSQKLLQLIGTKDLFPDAETPPEVEEFLQWRQEMDRLRDRGEWN